MADFSGMLDGELQNRLETITRQLDAIFKKLGSPLVEIGHLREEAASILKELRERSQKDGG